MTQIVLEQLMFFDAGTFNPQFRRTLSSSLDSGKLDILKQATNYGQNVTAAALARIGNSAITLSNQIESQVNIANGWQTQRFRFFLKIVLVRDSGYAAIRDCVYLTGYTNHADVSYAGTLDPQMILVINSRINVRETVSRQGVISTAITTNEQVLRGLANPGGSYAARDYTMRPSDILHGIGAQVLLEEAANGFAQDLMNAPLNTSNTFVNGIQTNARSNNTGANHLSRILSTSRAGFDGQGNFDEMAQIMQSSSVLAEDTLVSNDYLWQTLIRMTDGHFNQEGIIQWRDLCRLCPNAEAQADIFKYGGVINQAPIPTQGDSENWAGQTQEQYLAAFIATTLPGILSAEFIGSAGILISNESGAPEVVFFRPPMSFIANLDITNMLNKVLHNIHAEIVPVLTENNQRLVRAEIECDVCGHTNVRISVDGGPLIPFNSPTFADSSFSPIITGNVNTYNNMVRDIRNISASLFERPDQIYQGNGYGGMPVLPSTQPVYAAPTTTSQQLVTPTGAPLSAASKFF